MSLAEIAESIMVEADSRLWLMDYQPSLEANQPTTFHLDTGPAVDECEAYADWLMARFLEQYSKDIRIASPTGAVLRVSPGLLFVETDDPFDYNDYRVFPEAREGRLRAGSVRPHWIRFDGMRVTDDLSKGWELALRPVANFPLCISEAAIPASVDDLIDKILERARDRGAALETFKEGNQYKQIVQQMIEAWDRGEFKTKSAAKARFGRSRNTEEWLALWRELVSVRPLAAKPGRRSGSGIR